MPVPEASVDENDFAPPLHDDVGPSRKELGVNPVAHPHRAEQSAHCQLGLGIGAPNSGHVSASTLSGYPIHHI